MLELKKRLERIGQAVAYEFALHSTSEINVTFTEESDLHVFIVSVNTHPITNFSYKEMERIRKLANGD